MVGDDLHLELMYAAIGRDAKAQRALFAGDGEAAGTSFVEAAELYRRSWEAAPPRSYGRLIGMLKSAVLAGRDHEYSDYARLAVPDEDVASPPAAYARALAALLAAEDDAARQWASRMRGGSPAFERTAAAIVAIASHDQAAFDQALAAIVRDFEKRAEHLTGIAIADTALMLERLGERRGLRALVASPLLPRSRAPSR